jgi:hypothetical protein
VKHCQNLNLTDSLSLFIAHSKAGGTSLDLMKLFNNKYSVVRYVVSISTKFNKL